VETKSLMTLIDNPSTEAVQSDVPTHITEDEYLAVYAEQGYEWNDGELIAMSPVELENYRLIQYLQMLLRVYFEMNPIGEVLGEPFMMRVAPRRYREPDLMVVLNGNPHLTNTGLMGAADVCIEIVSPESIERDYGKKLVEYEQLGVPEYWIFDPDRKASNFHRLNETGIYVPALAGENNIYQTPLLPKLKLDIARLWRKPFPTIVETLEIVKTMLAQA